MPTIEQYRMLDVWLPSIGVSLVFFSIFIFLVVKVVWKLSRQKQRLVNRCFFEILRLAFRDFKRDRYGRDTIYGHEIGRISFAVLVAITVPVILSACFITFWNIYMVEEQVGTKCNPNFDCFPVWNGTIQQKTPVLNCSIWSPDTEYQCYRLVFNYVSGISATGGILFFANVMIKLFTITLLAPHNIQNLFCKWMCYSVVIMGGAAVTILFVLLHTTIPDTQDTVFQNATSQIQFVLYTIVLIVIFFITGPLLIYGTECEAPYKSQVEPLDTSV